jgi:hypothetical protein
MTARKITPIGMSVHLPDESPIYGESTTHVVVEDEAAGPYIVLRQFGEESKVGEVRLDLEELEAVLRAARMLIRAQPKDVRAGYIPENAATLTSLAGLDPHEQ